jgi:DNA-binding CsgD family transcriptional regulator
VLRLISGDVTRLVGYAPNAGNRICLDSFVHPSDVDALLEVFSRVTSHDTNVAIDVRVRAADGSWWPVHLTVGPASSEAPAFGVAEAPVERMTLKLGGPQADRIAELEQHLIRVAREVEAAGLVGRGGLIPDPNRVPALGDLTSRQRQILTRLVQGERVPAIADAMYLSPSTIRNHLSLIYKKLGVHSQAELIKKLQPGEEVSADR